jgi:hypothetical protein
MCVSDRDARREPAGPPLWTPFSFPDAVGSSSKGCCVKKTEKKNSMFSQRMEKIFRVEPSAPFGVWNSGFVQASSTLNASDSRAES